MKTVFSFFATILFSANAFSQTSTDLTCRSEAKKTALETYTLCIDKYNAARTKELETINKEYKQEAAALKAKYEAKIQQALAPNGLSSSNVPASKAPVVRKTTVIQAPVVVVAPKPVKGIAKTLPTKAPSEQNLQIQTEAAGTKVVSAQPEGTLDLEESASDAASVNLIEFSGE